MKLRKDKIQSRIILLAAAATVLFNMNTLFVQTLFSREMYAVITAAFYAVLFFWGAASGKMKKIPESLIVIFLFVAVIILASSLINRDTNILYFVMILELFKALTIVLLLDFDTFCGVYINVISIMAFISLSFYTVQMIYPTITDFAVRTYNDAGTALDSFGIYFSYPMDSMRNTGFLSEPGDYQHYLNVALLLCMFLPSQKDKKGIFNKARIPVLAMTSVTTFSSPGLIFLSMIILAYMISNINDAKKFIKASLCVILAVIAIFNIDFLSSRFEYSYSKLEGTHTSSLDVRLTSIIAGVKVGLNHFLIGAGIDKGAIEMEEVFTANGLIYDQTSTPAAFFAMFGFFFAMLLTVLYMRSFALSIKTKNLAIIVVILGILLSINNERLIFELTYYIFFVYGCMPKSSFKSNNKLKLNQNLYSGRNNKNAKAFNKRYNSRI